MVDEFDNRLRFPPTLIDFLADVGETGQDHDDIPAPGQARFDHIRMFLIGLLANQASDGDLPTQFRSGTLYYNRQLNAFHYHDGSSLSVFSNELLSKAIPLQTGSDPEDVLSLFDWFTTTEAQLSGVRPRIHWSGTSTKNDNLAIPVPESAQEQIKPFTDMRPLVYINGRLIDPRKTNFSSGCPTTIELDADIVFDNGDEYTVIVEGFNLFITDDVPAT